MKPLNPVRPDILRTGQQCGWTTRQIGHNQWRLERGLVTLDVSFTVDETHIFTVHVDSPRESWWMHHRERNKRNRVIEILKGGELT